MLFLHIFVLFLKLCLYSPSLFYTVHEALPVLHHCFLAVFLHIIFLIFRTFTLSRWTKSHQFKEDYEVAMYKLVYTYNLL
jgi:hypothetical protein